MAVFKHIYAFDCGTTNWRICRLNCQETPENGGRRRLEPISDPQVVTLSTFTTASNCLPAALLLDSNLQVQSYGQNAYELAHEPDKLPYLRDVFKPCIGNSSVSSYYCYTHQEALNYTQLLLSQVVEQLEREKPNCLARGSGNLFLFAHPVHWGYEKSGGQIDGQILTDFARAVRKAFPPEVQDSIHFVPEPEGALLSLMQLGQLSTEGSRYILVVDAGGGTTDFVAGRWTPEGLEDVRYYGELHGGVSFDRDLAEYLAEILQVPQEHRGVAWPELRDYGRRLKESLSQQAQVDAAVPVTMRVMLELLEEDGKSLFLSQNLHFTCQDFEQRTQRTRDALEKLIWKALVEMGLRKSDIEQVVLVGGAARLYLVPRVLQQIFGSSVSVVYGDPPERTVVRGVALWAVQTKAEKVTVPIEQKEKKSKDVKVSTPPLSGNLSKRPNSFRNPSKNPFAVFKTSTEDQRMTDETLEKNCEVFEKRNDE
jgi:hypothetical protein